MQLSELSEAVGGVERLEPAGPDPRIVSITADSRQVEDGGLFIALVGEEFDGHDFVGEAVAAGAAAVLVERSRLDRLDPGVPVLVADDTRRELGPLAAEFFGHPSRELQVVGTTGTNGKTTTTRLLASVFRATGRSVGSIGTVGYRWGEHELEGENTTPGALELQRLMDRMREDGVDTVVMEVSSHGLATHRLRGTNFDAGIFTNFSQDHLDFHGDLETYRRVKRSLFTELLPRSDRRGRPAAVINADDETGRELLEDVIAAGDLATTSFGLAGEVVDVRGTIRSRSLEGTRFEFTDASGTTEVALPLLGDFNVENALAAAAAARALDVEHSRIRRGLESVDSVPGRLESVGASDSDPAVFVDYAHSPDALGRALEVLRPLTPGRLAVVFGCGGDRDREKRPEMGRIAREYADRVYVTSDNPRSESPRAIVEAILDGLEPERESVAVEIERERAIERAIEEAGPDDVVLVAGKGHEQYQEFDGRRRPFDDRRVAAEALEARP